MNRGYWPSTWWAKLTLGFVLLTVAVFGSGLASEALEKIKLGTAVKLSPPYYLTVAAAEEQGFWRQKGLDVEWIPFRSGAPLFQAVTARAVLLGLAPLGSFFPAVESGVPALMVSSLQTADEFAIWVRADSPIKSPKDLRGARFGVPALRGVGEAYIRALAAALGFPKEVKILGVGGISQAMAGLKTGVIDAINQPPSIMIMLELKGEVRKLVAMTEYLPKPWIAQIVFAHREFAAGEPSVMTKAVNAVLMANNFILDNPGWALAKMREFSGYSEEGAQSVYKYLRFSRDGKIDRQALENVLNFLIDYGIVSRAKVPSLPRLYTEKFLGKG